ncbi:MAG: cysteine methyltransferase [Rhizobiales bacterium NRL2]|jgi:methylated-DNA-[protein]-cysteine S-methyltransferase|nr:MAG: cysteine methyltransferase [Rhizobiales bacterium NRL2]
MPVTLHDSPLGTIRIESDGAAITALRWSKSGWPDAPEDCGLHDRAADQLAAYFAGELDEFDLPLRPAGSNFQRSVWAAMQAIPKGATRTYGDVAGEIGAPARAVGTACGQNPIPVIIPCHRIVAANGSLGGFSAAGGVEDKVWLLRHEGVLL